jgi:hypothetical protein
VISICKWWQKASKRKPSSISLVALDVHRIQGYLIARPMSDTALLHWMSTTSYACLDAAV